MKLEPLTAELDTESLAERIAAGFNGDRDAPRGLLAQIVDDLIQRPRAQPWGSYLVSRADEPVCVGAFKSAPDAAGRVEIAYMTFPAYEGQGFATLTVRELTDLAFAHGVAVVLAHTLPQENASTRALRHNAFAFAGEHVDPEDGPVWRWERARA